VYAQSVSASERIIHDLLSSAATNPGTCTRYYDEAGRLVAAGACQEQARYEGRRYWHTAEPGELYWAYRITPIHGGTRREDHAHGGPLLPDRNVQAAAESLRAVEDYARWYPGFAAGEVAPAEHIWGIGPNAQGRWTGLCTYEAAVRRCLLGLTRHGQLAAIALAGVGSPDTIAALAAQGKVRAPAAPLGTTGEATSEAA
jgi:hypothetical protein